MFYFICFNDFNLTSHLYLVFNFLTFVLKEYVYYYIRKEVVQCKLLFLLIACSLLYVLIQFVSGKIQ